MVEKLVRLTAEQRSNFVAYLDGELDEQQTQQIEQLLAQNAIARHDMESLASTWELLDVLPRPKAPDDFSQKTMATLQLENQSVSLQDQPWFQNAKQICLLVGGWGLLLLLGFVSFLAVRSVPPSSADVTINNYPLLKQLDRYQEIGSKEFLEQLNRNPVWSNRDVSITRKNQP